MALVPAAARGVVSALRSPLFRSIVQRTPASSAARRLIFETAGAELGNMARKRLRKGVSALFKSRKRRRFQTPQRKNSRVKARLRTKVGERFGHGDSKRNQTLQNKIISTRTLYSDNLFTISRGTAIYQRMQDVVNFKGAKVCLSLRLTAGAAAHTANGEKLFINIAVLSAKEGTLTGQDSVPVTDFFRGNDDNRFQDFADTLHALEYHCLPINTDIYNVHKHKRITLGPFNATERFNTRNVMFYVKVNRQIRYDDSPFERPIKPMYLVYWCDFQMKDPANVAIASMLDMQSQIIRYFKEPK